MNPSKPIKHGPRQYECPYCGKTYKENRTAMAHIMRVHGANDQPDQSKKINRLEAELAEAKALEKQLRLELSLAHQPEPIQHVEWKQMTIDDQGENLPNTLSILNFQPGKFQVYKQSDGKVTILFVGKEQS